MSTISATSQTDWYSMFAWNHQDSTATKGTNNIKASSNASMGDETNEKPQSLLTVAASSRKGSSNLHRPVRPNKILLSASTSLPSTDAPQQQLSVEPCEQVFSFEVEETDDGKVEVKERLNSPPRLEHLNDKTLPSSVLDFDETASEPNHPLSPTRHYDNDFSHSEIASPPSRYYANDDEAGYLSPPRSLEVEARQAFASPSSMTARRLGKREVPRSLMISPERCEDHQTFSTARSRRAPSAITNDEQAYLFHAMHRALVVKSAEVSKEKLRERARKRAEDKPRPPSPFAYRPEGEESDEEENPRPRSRYVFARREPEESEELLKKEDNVLLMGRLNLSSVIILQSCIRRFIAMSKYQRLVNAVQARLRRKQAGVQSRQHIQQRRNEQRQKWAAGIIFHTVRRYQFLCVLERRCTARRAAITSSKQLQREKAVKETIDGTVRATEKTNQENPRDISVSDHGSNIGDQDELETWIEQQVHSSATTIQRCVACFLAKRKFARENKPRLARISRQNNAARILQRAFKHNRAQRVLGRFISLRARERHIQNARSTIYRAITWSYGQRVLGWMMEDRRIHNAAATIYRAILWYHGQCVLECMMEERRLNLLLTPEDNAASTIQRTYRRFHFLQVLQKRIEDRQERNLPEALRDRMRRERLGRHGKSKFRTLCRARVRKVLKQNENRRQLAASKSCNTKQGRGI